MEGAIVTEAEINYGLCPPLDEGCTCYLQEVPNVKPEENSGCGQSDGRIKGGVYSVIKSLLQ